MNKSIHDQSQIESEITMTTALGIEYKNDDVAVIEAARNINDEEIMNDEDVVDKEISAVDEPISTKEERETET